MACMSIAKPTFISRWKNKTMKKILVTMTALVLTMAAQAQISAIDTAQFVAVYDYECRTADDEGKNVVDKMEIVVQIGQTVTKSMPRSKYVLTDEQKDVVAEYLEEFLHMPTIWIGWPEGRTTVREFFFPNEFEGCESTPEIRWKLTDDTLEVCGYRCSQATATFRGVEWRVFYTEEIPLSAGPWRLRGLPGLIVKAESKSHTFCLAELRQETTPIIFEQNPDVQKTTYEKLLKHRNEIYGDRQYAKNPIYYVPDIRISIKNMSVFDSDGRQIIMVDGSPLLTKAHVYQPLELKFR